MSDRLAQRSFALGPAVARIAAVGIVVVSLGWEATGRAFALGDDETPTRPAHPQGQTTDRGQGVDVRASGEGSGRRLSLVGIAPAIDVLREIARTCALRFEEPDEAIRSLLEGRVLCETSGLGVEEVCDIVAGTCGLRVEFPSADELRVVAPPDATPLERNKRFEAILDGVGGRLDALSETDGECPLRGVAALALARAWFTAGTISRAAAQFAAIDSPTSNAEMVLRRLARLGLAWCDVEVGRTAAGFAAAEKIVGEIDNDQAAIEASVLLARDAMSRGDGKLAVQRACIALRAPTIERSLLDTIDAAIATCADAASKRVAYDAVRRALDDRTGTPAEAPLRLRLARIAEATGDTAGAVAQATQAVRLEGEGPAGIAALRMLGRLLAQSDPAGALLCLATALDRVPPVERASAALDVARLCRRLGLVNVAVERYLDAGAPADSSSPIGSGEATRELAELLFDEGQPTRAVELLIRLATVPGYERHAAVGLLRARLLQRDLSGALAVVRSEGARLMTADGVRALGDLAAQLAREGKHAEALEVLALDSRRNTDAKRDANSDGKSLEERR